MNKMLTTKELSAAGVKRIVMPETNKNQINLVYYQVFPTYKWVLTCLDDSVSWGVDKKMWAIFTTKEDILYFLNKINLTAIEKDSDLMDKKDYTWKHP